MSEREAILSQFSKYELVKELHDRGANLTKIVATFTDMAKENGTDVYTPEDSIARYNEATGTFIRDGQHITPEGELISEEAAYKRASGGW